MRLIFCETLIRQDLGLPDGKYALITHDEERSMWTLCIKVIKDNQVVETSTCESTSKQEYKGIREIIEVALQAELETTLLAPGKGLTLYFMHEPLYARFGDSVVLEVSDKPCYFPADYR